MDDLWKRQAKSVLDASTRKKDARPSRGMHCWKTESMSDSVKENKDGLGLDERGDNLNSNEVNEGSWWNQGESGKNESGKSGGWEYAPGSSKDKLTSKGTARTKDWKSSMRSKTKDWKWWSMRSKTKDWKWSMAKKSTKAMKSSKSKWGGEGGDKQWEPGNNNNFAQLKMKVAKDELEMKKEMKLNQHQDSLYDEMNFFIQS